jgi:predicted RNA methylase
MTFRICILAFAIVALATGTAAAQQAPLRSPDVIFVPTPQEVVDVMLKIAKVTKSDVVYDLGSGDGRIPITAARVYGARAVGVDIDPVRIGEANANLKAAAAADPTIASRVRFLNQDLFTTDISEATVVTLYLLPSLNIKLLPILNKMLKPGTRVVSHAFDMGPDIKPDIDPVNVNGRTVYFYTVPIN